MEGAGCAGRAQFVMVLDQQAAAEKAHLDPATTTALVDDYGQAQLRALKTGLLVAALVSCAALFVTGSLPARAGPDPAAQPRADAALAGRPAA